MNRCLRVAAIAILGCTIGPLGSAFVVPAEYVPLWAILVGTVAGLATFVALTWEE